jgi:ATP-dependent helicase/nuclease subunit B
VQAELARWEIAVDDSAGTPLAATAPGLFARLIADLLADGLEPVPLLSLLKHPLAKLGMASEALRHAARVLELAVLRGPRPEPSVDGLKRALAAARRSVEDGEERDAARRRLTAADWSHAERLLERLSAVFADIDLAANRRPAAHLVAAHKALCDAFAADEASNAEALYAQPAGDALRKLFDALTDGLDLDWTVMPADYPALFTALAAGRPVRPQRPAHPRLHILGLLEARLLRFDLVILGGLNEGVWPRDAAIDPFLSRPMRAALGLPSPEQRIGLSAHDFAQLAAAPEVMLTRATREGGRPAKPSRWIVRLKNILKGAGAINSIDQTHNYEILARSLDAPLKTISICAPRPRPPVDARPTAFSVTRVEKLLRDPYGVYARYILRLKTLDALNERFGPRHMGELFHFILKAFTVEDPPDETLERRERLDALFDAHAAQYGLTEAERPFWAPRIADAFAFLAAWEGERRAAGGPVILEGEGRWTFALDGRDFTLAARADRIDRLHDGSAFIIDYKTGAPPTLKQNDAFSPQLPLTGLIVRKGGFAELGAAPVSGFEYVRIIGRKNDGKDDVCAAGADCAGHIAEAEESLLALLRHFNDPDTPYLSQPRPQYLAKYGEYDHLARRRERHAQGGDD